MKRVYLTYLLLVTGFICLHTLRSAAQVDSVNTIKEVKVISINKAPSIIPSQEINHISFKRYNAYNVADAIRNFSGVNVKDYGGIGGLKTVSVRSLGANHTAITYDGIVVTDAHNGQIDLGKFSLENVESIALYNAQPADLPQPARSYASASLIAVKTIRPAFDSLKRHQLSAGFTTGSFGLVNPVLQWQHQLSDGWSYSINTSWQKANGKYKFNLEGYGFDSLATRNNDDLDALLLDAGIYGRFSQKNQIHIRANYYDSERGLPGAIISYNSLSSQRLWNKDFFVQASFLQEFNPKLKMKLAHKTSQNSTRYTDPEFLNQQGGLDQEFHQQEIYQSAAFSYQFSKVFGLNYAADVSLTNLDTNLPQYSYPERLSLLQVLDANFTYKKWKASLSYLNTYITEKVKSGEASPSRSVFTPTLLVSYQPKENHDFLIRAFYKEIFRYPTFNDLYYTNFGNRSLEPEFVKQINAGVTYNKAFDGKWSFISLSTDVYFNQVKDKIVSTPNKNLFLWTVRNIGSVDIYGVDAVFNTQYNINNNWAAVLSGNYTYQLALDVSNKQSAVYNNQIPYTPKHTASANVGLKNAAFGVYYNHLFSSGRYYLGDNSPEYFVPGFSISDVSVVRDFAVLKKPLTIAAEVNNIFNKSYALIRSFPMPGTSFRFSIKTTI